MSTTSSQKTVDSEAESREYFDRVVEHLSLSDKNRQVITFVEHWNKYGHPTRKARLHQVRAFLHLCLMDRAWVKINEILDSDPEDPEGLLLASEMFIQRGWPSRARKLLASPPRTLEGNPAVKVLLERAGHPPRHIPPNAREIERDGNSAQQLVLAERFLATGSFLRARTLLEKLKRSDPYNKRIDDLLWALRGDFSEGDKPLVEIAAHLAPGVERTDSNAESNDFMNMDDVTAARIDLPGSDQKEAEFPSLFRKAFPDLLPLTEDDSAEVTQKISMDLPSSTNPNLYEGSESDDARPTFNKPEDTQIMMVIRGQGVTAPEPGSRLHKKRSTDFNLKESLDLSGYRRHMGMDSELPPAGPDPQSDLDDDFLEEEDEDLVVVTRREEKDPPPHPAKPPIESLSAGFSPIQVIEKHPTPTSSPANVHASPGAGPAPSEDEQIKPVAVTQRPPVDPAKPLLILLVLMLGLFSGAVLLLRSCLHTSPGQLVEQADGAISSDTFLPLLDAEARLDKLVSAGEDPLPEAQAMLGRVELLLWTDYLGDTSRLKAARKNITSSMKADDIPTVAYLAQAELALAEHRREASMRALQHLSPDDPDRQILEASMALQSNDLPAAAAAINKAIASSTSPRTQRLQTCILLRSGAIDAANRVLDAMDEAHVMNDRTRMLRQVLEVSRLPAKARLKAVEQWLSDFSRDQQLPARLQAGMYKELARLPGIASDPRQAAAAYSRAFDMDQTDPELLYQRALTEIGSYQTVKALSHAQQAASLAPGFLDAQLVATRSLIYLDRLDQARIQVRNVAGWIPDRERLPVLLAWLAAVGDDDLAETSRLLKPYLESHPEDYEASWLMGYALARNGRNVQALRFLPRLDTPMGSWSDAYRRFAPAILATRLLAGDRNRRAIEPLILKLAPRDPWIYLLLAMAHEQHGRETRAATYLDLAAEIAPELGRVQFERARHYLEYGGNSPSKAQRARQSWDSYLRLEPSGPRAEIAKNRAGTEPGTSGQPPTSQR